MSRTKSAFWGSISSQVFMIISMGLTIIITPLVLKYLDKEEYGFYTILFQLVGYLSMLDFGLSVAIARSLAANRGEDDDSKQAINRIISTSFFTYSVLGILVIIIGLCLIPFIPNLFKMSGTLREIAVPITLTLSIFVGIQFPLKVFNGIFYAHQRQLLSNTMGFFLSLLSSVLPLIFLYFGKGLWSFVYTNIVASSISIVITFLMMRKFYSYLRIRFMFFQKKLLLELFNFGFFSFLNAIAVQIVFFTDRLFIGSLVSLSAATMFSITAKAPELSRELIFRITDSAYPAMVEISSKENNNKLKEVHQKLLLITVCCSAIAAWMVFIINPWFIQLWVGENLFAGKTVLVLALCIMLQLTVTHLSALCLYGIGIIKGLSILSLIEATINLFLTMWLGKMYGIKGILIATIIASTLTSSWYVPYVTMKHLRISFLEYFFKPLILPLTVISALGLLIYLLTVNLFNEIALTWVNFFFVSSLLAILFAVFCWLFFLKKYLSQYVPNQLKKYLFIPEAV